MDATTEYLHRLDDLAGRLRQPAATPPTGMAPEIFALYQGMFRANFFASLADAFPESRRHVAPALWEQWVDDFLAGGTCPSPSFHAVPDAFFAFLMGKPAQFEKVPAYLPALLHWEWLTLTLAISKTPEPVLACGELWEQSFQLADSARVQHYPFAVHLPLAPGQEATKRDCYLLVYQNCQGAVISCELPLAQARLATALAEEPRIAREAQTLAFPQDEYSSEWTLAVLRKWWEDGILQATSQSSSRASPSRP